MISPSPKLKLVAAAGLSVAIIAAVTYYVYLYRRRRSSAVHLTGHRSSSDDRLTDNECNYLWISDDIENSGEGPCSAEPLVNFDIVGEFVSAEHSNEDTSLNIPLEYGYCEAVLRRPPALSAEECFHEAVIGSCKGVVNPKRKLSMECTNVDDSTANTDVHSTAVLAASRGLPSRPFRRRKMIGLISDVVKSQHSNRLDETTACSLVKLLRDHEQNVILQCLEALRTVSSSAENQVLLDSFNVSSRIRELLEVNALSQKALILLTDCISTLSNSTTLRAKLTTCVPQLIQLLDCHIRSGRFRDACLQALLKLVSDIPDGNPKHYEILVCNLLHVFNPDGNSRAAELAVALLAKLASNSHIATVILNCKTSHRDVTRFLISKNQTIVLNFLTLLDRLAQGLKNPPNAHVGVLHGRSLAVALFSPKQLPITRQRLASLLSESASEEVKRLLSVWGPSFSSHPQQLEHLSAIYPRLGGTEDSLDSRTSTFFLTVSSNTAFIANVHGDRQMAGSSIIELRGRNWYKYSGHDWFLLGAFGNVLSVTGTNDQGEVKE